MRYRVRDKYLDFAFNSDEKRDAFGKWVKTFESQPNDILAISTMRDPNASPEQRAAAVHVATKHGLKEQFPPKPPEKWKAKFPGVDEKDIVRGKTEPDWTVKRIFNSKDINKWTRDPVGSKPFGRGVLPRTKVNPAGYDKDAVRKAVADKNYPISLVDPTTLADDGDQGIIRRDGVAHYMEKPDEVFADKDQAGNQVPVIYRTKTGALSILSGRHRATAAIIMGRPLKAKVVDAP